MGYTKVYHQGGHQKETCMLLGLFFTRFLDELLTLLMDLMEKLYIATVKLLDWLLLEECHQTKRMVALPSKVCIDESKILTCFIIPLFKCEGNFKWCNIPYNNFILLGSTLNASSPFINSPEKKRIMRPDIDYLLDTDFDYKCPNYAIDLMVDCWAELPEHR